MPAMKNLNFTNIDRDTFLSEYWQKKPVVLKQAMPGFINPLAPEELIGLSLEEGVECRIVVENPASKPAWQLKSGPFTNTDFEALPKTHWTLLVQGMEQLLPEIQSMQSYFDFIPQWRVDDVMISYAALHGSVGPHYDNYDVFLLQAQGQRRWMLTTQDCHEENYLQDVDLRIMTTFHVEADYVLEPGDILYLPPHVGHHGISLSDDCMTYSFGYRSYPGIEMLCHFCDHLHEQDTFKTLCKDPDWRDIKHTAELPDTAWQQAQSLLKSALTDDKVMKEWFGQFTTRLDSIAESYLPDMLETADNNTFLILCQSHSTLHRHPSCKMAYQVETDDQAFAFYCNGVAWGIENVDTQLIQLIANHRIISTKNLSAYLGSTANQHFLLELWQLQWLQFLDENIVPSKISTEN